MGNTQYIGHGRPQVMRNDITELLQVLITLYQVVGDPDALQVSKLSFRYIARMTGRAYYFCSLTDRGIGDLRPYFKRLLRVFGFGKGFTGKCTLIRFFKPIEFLHAESCQKNTASFF